MIYGYSHEKYREEIEEIHDLLAEIQDPEFPQSLGELKVVSREGIRIREAGEVRVIEITWVPTVAVCSYASQIGLCLVEKLRIDFPDYGAYKLDIRIQEEKHNDRLALDKQINDKERVTAALENPALRSFVQGLIKRRDNY